MTDSTGTNDTGENSGSQERSASEQGGIKKAGLKNGDAPKLPSNKGEQQSGAALEVVVDHGIDRAIRVLKRKLIKEGLFKELKSRRYYEKPSEKKKRKEKESKKKLRKEEARQRKNAMLFG